jgi:predicted dehydrogenase
MHAEHTIMALESGKHVLCQKPMASTVNEAKQMIRAFKKANKILLLYLK